MISRISIILLALWGSGWTCIGCGTQVDRSAGGGPVGSGAESPPHRPDGRLIPPLPGPADRLFARQAVLDLTIELSRGELQRLLDDNRRFVRCTVREAGGPTWTEVGIKLKGAAGSFRDFDDKPALTLRFGKYEECQSFYGLDKLHLNNSVQDETWLNELLCSELFLAAGIPAPRVTHARVRLGERDVGLYVLKEGFDHRFLARHFARPNGNLYDGGFCQEIDAPLERDAGEGVSDRQDLVALCAACSEPDDARRWELLGNLLEVEAFLTFCAMELMTAHWDGYCQSRNNFRVYFETTSGRAVFFPHGMDQMFGEPHASILEPPGAMVAAAVMQNPRWRARYRQRLRELLPLFSSDRLLIQVDAVTPRLQAVLQSIDPEAARVHAERVAELKERIIARAEQLASQVEQPEPEPSGPPALLAFDESGIMNLADWQPASETDDAHHELVDTESGARAYRIVAGPGGRCIASWRCGVRLPRGSYRLVGRARTESVAPIHDDKGHGAGLRISGASRTVGLDGSSDWQTVEYTFDVAEEEQEVVLVAELRTTAGEVWFDGESLRLERVEGE
ncbi:MAG: CotH kinase family protein [Planctomycetales bacterium]